MEKTMKPSAAAMRAINELHKDEIPWGYNDDAWPNRLRSEAAIIDAEFAPLVAAARLAVDNFERSDASGNDLGDDDHEAWRVLNAALAALERE